MLKRSTRTRGASHPPTSLSPPRHSSPACHPSILSIRVESYMIFALSGSSWQHPISSLTWNFQMSCRTFSLSTFSSSVSAALCGCTISVPAAKMVSFPSIPLRRGEATCIAELQSRVLNCCLRAQVARSTATQGRATSVSTSICVVHIALHLKSLSFGFCVFRSRHLPQIDWCAIVRIFLAVILFEQRDLGDCHPFILVNGLLTTIPHPLLLSFFFLLPSQ